MFNKELVHFKPIPIATSLTLQSKLHKFHLVPSICIDYRGQNLVYQSVNIATPSNIVQKILVPALRPESKK